MIKKILNKIRYIIPFVLLGYLFTIINPYEIWSALLQADVLTIAISVVMFATNFLLQFLRWKLLVNSADNTIKNSAVFRSLMQGYSTAILTPMRLGEAAGRYYAVNRLEFVQYSVLIIMEKVFASLSILLVGSVFSTIYTFNYLPQYFYFMLTVSIVIPVSVITVLIVYRKKKYGIKLISKFKKVESLLRKINTGIKNIKLNVLFKLAVLSVFIFVIYTLQLAVLVFAFSKTNLIDTFFAAQAVYFIKFFFSIVAVGDLGIREFSSVFFMSKVGIPEAAALNGSLLIFILNIVIPSIVGSLFYFRRK